MLQIPILDVNLGLELSKSTFRVGGADADDDDDDKNNNNNNPASRPDPLLPRREIA